ncbi:MAG TPA: hypothetical protein VHM25_02310 [Polyangiaceae bacterium]|jgi:hypothetical protein|nr:hypothetical protein [Polyangiaceae bacterium]
MTNQTITINRAAHTVRGLIFLTTITATIIDIGVDNARKRNPYVAVRWPTNGRLYTFRINTGWGEAPVKSFQIAPDDLKLIQQAARDRGFKVIERNAPPTERRNGTKRPRTLERQIPLFEVAS